MTTTAELRRLLDERGIKWTTPIAHMRDTLTQWVVNGFNYEALELSNGMLYLTAEHQDDFITPEQAIEATLGNKECERVKHGTKPCGQPRYRCSVCNYGIGDYRWAYCPKCGCKIKEDTK